MDNALNKGNLIDFFAVLLPGMVLMILSAGMNFSYVSISIEKDIATSITVLIVFVICSYIAGLLLLELAVILQKSFPPVFDYYTEAIRKDEGIDFFKFYKIKVPLFQDNRSSQQKSKKTKSRRKFEIAQNKYEKKEYWMLTHQFSDQVERRKAYSMMNRSLAAVPIAYILFQAFTVEIAGIGVWPARWQVAAIFITGLFFYHRARRQALIIYREVNQIFKYAFNEYQKTKRKSTATVK